MGYDKYQELVQKRRTAASEEASSALERTALRLGEAASSASGHQQAAQTPSVSVAPPVPALHTPPVPLHLPTQRCPTQRCPGH